MDISDVLAGARPRAILSSSFALAGTASRLIRPLLQHAAIKVTTHQMLKLEQPLCQGLSNSRVMSARKGLHAEEPLTAKNIRNIIKKQYNVISNTIMW